MHMGGRYRARIGGRGILRLECCRVCILLDGICFRNQTFYIKLNIFKSKFMKFNFRNIMFVLC
jgi:hypothetical protein